MRHYGFKSNQIPPKSKGNISQGTDPKQAWADAHPEQFPININRGTKEQLLRIPGIGPTVTNRIISQCSSTKIESRDGISPLKQNIEKAKRYIQY